MHSLGYRIISENAKKLKLKNDFLVLSSEKLRIDLLGDASQIINLDRNLFKETEKCRRKGKCKKDENLNKCKICKQYRKILHACNAIDYDDQIMLACKLLRNYPDIMNKEKEKSKYLLVDEYQDINASQYEMIRLLSDGQRDGLFVVGDDCQSIYSFRGGSPEYVRNFENHFRNEDPKVVKKNKCHRCPEHILKGGLDIIGKFDPEGISAKEKITFNNDNNNKIKLYNVRSDKAEAKIIAKEVKRLLPSGDILILIPKWELADEIKLTFRNYHINYDCRKETDKLGISFIDAVRMWLDNKNNNFALRALIQILADNGFIGVPSAKVIIESKKAARESSLLKISNLWKKVIDEKLYLFDIIKKESKQDVFIKKIYKVLIKISKLREKEPHEFLHKIIQIIRPWGKNTERLLAEIQDLLEEMKSRRGGDVVRILTMHSAKGLEADYVFIIGLDKGIFPRESSNSEDSDITQEEQARLLYVSMSRAKRELYLFHAQTRSGKVSYFRRPYLLEVSPFIEAISQEHISN